MYRISDSYEARCLYEIEESLFFISNISEDSQNQLIEQLFNLYDLFIEHNSNNRKRCDVFSRYASYIIDKAIYVLSPSCWNNKITTDLASKFEFVGIHYIDEFCKSGYSYQEQPDLKIRLLKLFGMEIPHFDNEFVENAFPEWLASQLQSLKFNQAYVHKEMIALGLLTPCSSKRKSKKKHTMLLPIENGLPFYRSLKNKSIDFILSWRPYQSFIATHPNSSGLSRIYIPSEYLKSHMYGELVRQQINGTPVVAQHSNYKVFTIKSIINSFGHNDLPKSEYKQIIKQLGIYLKGAGVNSSLNSKYLNVYPSQDDKLIICDLSNECCDSKGKTLGLTAAKVFSKIIMSDGLSDIDFNNFRYWLTNKCGLRGNDLSDVLCNFLHRCYNNKYDVNNTTFDVLFDDEVMAISKYIRDYLLTTKVRMSCVEKLSTILHFIDVPGTSR